VHMKVSPNQYRNESISRMPSVRIEIHLEDCRTIRDSTDVEEQLISLNGEYDDGSLFINQI